MCQNLCQCSRIVCYLSGLFCNFFIRLKVPFCQSEDRQEVLFDRINGISDNQAKGRQKQYISSVHLSLSQSLTVFCSRVQHIPRNIYDLDPDLHIDFFKYPCNQFVSLCYIAPLPTMTDTYLSAFSYEL